MRMSSNTIPQFILTILLVCCIYRTSFGLTKAPATTRRTTFGIVGSIFPFNMVAETTDPPTKQAVRWGIIGLGDVTETKSGPPFWKCDNSELVAVMRRTPGKAAAWAARVPGGNCVGYDSLDAFLQHDPLDAVYVATRPGSHLEVCQRVAAAGIQHVYIEKPVGRCAAETKAIVDAFEAIGGTVYTAYISRAYPRTQAIRELLGEGVIGDKVTDIKYHLSGSGGARDIDGPDLPWRFDAEQSGGGLVMDVGCHMIDRIDYLVGPLGSVKGTALRKSRDSPGTVEDYVSIHGTVTQKESGEPMSVTFVWDFSSKDTVDVLEIAGTAGTLTMEGMNPTGPIIINTSDGLHYEKTFGSMEHTAQFMIQAVTNAILGMKHQEFLSKGENAIRTSTVLDVALSAYYGDRGVGFWNRPPALSNLRVA